MSVRLEDKGAVLIVHNREEKRGAITPEFYTTIAKAVAMASDPRVRCIILTGGAFFCAGGDLRALKTRAELPPEQRREKIELLHAVIRAMRDCDVPIIAAIEGGAAGAGLSLTLASDMIVAAKGARFTAAYVKAGLTPDGGLTHALADLLPRQMSMEMVLLGRPVEAERLAALGVVTEVCAAGEALTRAEALAAELINGPRQAQSRIRHLMARASDADFASHLDLEAEFMVEAQATHDAAEGIAAFIEKRMPEFKP